MRHIIAIAVMGIMLIASVAYSAERYFAVTAYNDFGESTYSEEVSCNPDHGRLVTLQWNRVETATGYKIYWTTSSGAPYEHSEDLGDNDTHTFIVVGCPGLTIVCE